MQVCASRTYLQCYSGNRHDSAYCGYYFCHTCHNDLTGIIAGNRHCCRGLKPTTNLIPKEHQPIHEKNGFEIEEKKVMIRRNIFLNYFFVRLTFVRLEGFDIIFAKLSFD